MKNVVQNLRGRIIKEQRNKWYDYYGKQFLQNALSFIYIYKHIVSILWGTCY